MEIDYLNTIKVISMILMFLMIIVMGNIPLRSTAFKGNQFLLDLTGAFSGGLFLSVGIIHLLPESMKQFHMYYRDQKIESFEEFPYACLITVLSFTLILYIEKIAFIHNHTNQDNHSYQVSVIQQQECIGELECPETTKPQIQQVSIKELDEITINSLTPYILQFAIGIHAFFEGLAIGIEQQVPQCLGISLAVVCHKWAEGLTLGLSFKKANTKIHSATIMIFIQGIINPIGILIGWILANQGYIITGIFQSISAGTFIYIATMEVIQEQFNQKSNSYYKMMMFLFAIGFISTIWKIEKLSF
ncbi:unnamed protein product [Paramecium pentaurelia]|uniref:Zinc/iron permease n=1 Tax=Paramecium pentaurelia TaxID=43138 RepID=A0A8S1VGM3_9CILI|nr:unnamed protein product [Paramecium pentaurelia]